MDILIDQDVCLGEKVNQKAGRRILYPKSYPLQISVNHSPTMHIYQTLRDVFELRGAVISGVCGKE